MPLESYSMDINSNPHEANQASQAPDTYAHRKVETP